jgi:hypothetical protein
MRHLQEHQYQCSNRPLLVDHSGEPLDTVEFLSSFSIRRLWLAVNVFYGNAVFLGR